jgi:PAS domain S-box-containing protein
VFCKETWFSADGLVRAMSAPDKKQPIPRTPLLLGKGDSPTGSHLQSLLPKIGYQIVVANNGPEARSILLAEGAPQLAVLDANMSGLSAIELCRELRGMRRQHFTYLIIFASWTEHLSRVAALEAGADDCLPSPVDLRELQLRLEKGSQVILARALQRSESFLRAITSNVNDLIFVLDEENKWIYANPSHRDYLGYDPAELEGRELLSLVHPDDRPLAEKTIDELVHLGLPTTIQLRMQHKDGRWRHVEAHHALMRNAAGDVDGIVVAARPIDDRILAEQHLRAAYSETELLFQSIPSILIGLNSQGVITRMNQTAAKSLGTTAQNILGRAIYDSGINWQHTDFKAEVQRWLQTENTYRCNTLSFLREGKIRFLGLNICRLPSLHDSAGTAFIVTGADITERRQLEEQLRQAQKLEAIGQLSAGVAHEINTPTQFVSDNVRFLKDSWQDLANLLQASVRLRDVAGQAAISTEFLEEFDRLKKKADIDFMLKEIPGAIDQSQEGLQRVAKIVRAIKEFSHPGSAEKKGVDLNKSIETTITVAQNEWKYVADLEAQFDPELGSVPCLSSELNQVVLNLIVNAAHAIADRLEADSGGKGKITVSTRRNAPWAEIEIQDTGQGIPPEIRSRVFEPFFTTKEVGKGTGQGLALAHSVVVNRHQGQIWFDSEVGVGTTFHIRIPLGAGMAVGASSAE